MATTIKVTCCICGDIDLEPSQLRLHAEGSGVDYSFTHCDTETRRHANPMQVSVLLALDVTYVPGGSPRPVLRCSCGLSTFHLADGVRACRNCDAPTPGLPPADRSCGR